MLWDQLLRPHFWYERRRFPYRIFPESSCSPKAWTLPKRVTFSHPLLWSVLPHVCSHWTEGKNWLHSQVMKALMCFQITAPFQGLSLQVAKPVSPLGQQRSVLLFLQNKGEETEKSTLKLTVPACRSTPWGCKTPWRNPCSRWLRTFVPPPRFKVFCHFWQTSSSD